MKKPKKPLLEEMAKVMRKEKAERDKEAITKGG